MTKIAPSILSADFSKMGAEVEKLEKCGADWIHCDVMDGVYVPNITFGMPMIKDIRKCTTLPIDAHLMITEPEKYVERFCDAGADIVTFHPEASKDAHNALKLIHNKGKKAGIVLNPDIDVEVAREYLDEVDMVLLMSVFPGYGGQKFITNVVPKISALKQMILATGKDIIIEIDGGINEANAPIVVKEGVDVLVAGSTVFKAPDTADIIKKLRG